MRNAPAKRQLPLARSPPSQDDAPQTTSQRARFTQTQPREQSGEGQNKIAKSPGAPRFSQWSRCWPTATVSWGRGWRSSHLAGEAVATEAVAHLRSTTPDTAAYCLGSALLLKARPDRAVLLA